MRHVPAMIVVLLLFGCVPQAELVKMRGEINDLRREVKEANSRTPDLSGVTKRQDELEAGIKGTADLQQRMADQGARFDQIQTDLQLLQGKLEENNYRMKELAQRVDDRGFKVAELTARLDQLENRLKSAPSGTAAPEAAAAAVAAAPTPTAAYQQAKADYDKGNFDLAIAGFENYLKLFPEASQADSAHYWIGECWYSKKDFEKAIERFTTVLSSYPKSEKAPGARLKIGYSYLNARNTAKAKENLNRVIKDYPGSREAELAREKLKQIGK
jgi:tol-pal system protein YbgF